MTPFDKPSGERGRILIGAAQHMLEGALHALELATAKLRTASQLAHSVESLGGGHCSGCFAPIDQRPTVRVALRATRYELWLCPKCAEGAVIERDPPNAFT